MKPLAFVVQGMLVALLVVALWRYASREREPGASPRSRSGAVPEAAPGEAQGGAQGAMRGAASEDSPALALVPTPAAVFVDPLAEASYKAGVFRIPLERLRPLEGGRWVVGAPHFVVEEVGEEHCVLLVGELSRLGESSASFLVDGKPRSSALAKYSREAGGMLRYLAVPAVDFRALWPAGLPPCSRWLKSALGTGALAGWRHGAPAGRSAPALPDTLAAGAPGHSPTPELAPLEPVILKQGARRALPREGLVSVRVVAGTSVVLERRALDEGYVLHATGSGESTLSVERLPGPHVRLVKVVVKPPAVRAARRGAEERLPPRGVFVIPGWTSGDPKD